MLDYFFAGGPLFMGLLTVVLIALLVGIKKFPHQLNTLGQLALALGVLGTALGLFEAFKAVEASKGVRTKPSGPADLKTRSYPRFTV